MNSMHRTFNFLLRCYHLIAMDAKHSKILTLIVGLSLLSYSIINIAAFDGRLLALSEKSAEIPFQKGMSFTTWTNTSFNTTATKQEFLEMQSIGVEWVAINHWWWQDYLNSSDIKIGQYSDTFENMTDCFSYARSIGLHILYKPMLNLAKTYDWRSYIVFSDAWIANYTWWMVENAKAAEAGGVEILSIGTEMGNMQVHSAEVRQMIAAIRAVYSGLLTYSANHDSYMFIDWWDAVDIIGISMYTMMTIAMNPTISDLQTVWNGMYYELEELALKWNLPVAFTEIGIQARDGSNMIPNDNQISLERDVPEMENYYLSLFQSRIWTALWFKGAYWWIWDYSDPVSNPNLDSFNPILIKDTIKAEYDKTHIIESVALPIASTLLPLIGGIILLVLVILRTESPILDRRYSLKKRRLDEKTGENTLNDVGITANEMKQNEILLGTSIGCLFSMIASSLTIGVYSVIQKSFSFAIILGLSTTETVITFAILLLASIIIGLIFLRVWPRYILIATFLLLLIVPYLAIGAHYQMIFLSSCFELIILFLFVSATVLFSIKCKRGNILHVIFVAIIVGGSFFILVLTLDALAMAFLIIPVAFAINAGQGVHSKKPVALTTSINSGKEVREEKAPIEMMLIMNSLLAGMIIPFGNAIINLVHMNYLSVAVHYIPALVAAGVILMVVMWRRTRNAERPRFDWAQIFSNKLLLVSDLVLGLGGFLFVLAGRYLVIWAFISGFYFIQYIGAILVNLKKSFTIDKIGRGYAYLAVIGICFVLGFMVNAIKGLLIYTVTFLVFKDGQFMRRDPLIDPVPPFNVPLVLDGFVLAIVVILATILLIYYRIVRSRKKRALFKNKNRNGARIS